jgi:hypothetical protein
MKARSLLLLLPLALAGCSHPNSKETQDIRDGMAFAQDNIHDPYTGGLGLAESVQGFHNSGEFLKRSPYFKLGADYQACKIIFSDVKNGLTAYKDNTNQSVYIELDIGAHDVLRNDLKTLKLSPKQFSEATGTSDLEAILASNPNQ